jgi:hypothetical protein
MFSLCEVQSFTSKNQEMIVNDDVTPDSILQLGLGFWSSKALLSAVELGVFTELAKGPLDALTLIERLRIHPRGARDFFDSLVALHMLDRNGDRYSNTQQTDIFLDRAKPSYLGGILEMANARAVWILGIADRSAAHGSAAE